MFLWHFPSGHPAWPLASTMPCGVRTFLERPVSARDRPAGRTQFNYNTALLRCQDPLNIILPQSLTQDSLPCFAGLNHSMEQGTHKNLGELKDHEPSLASREGS
jgi:hypothetical protein